MMTPFKPEDWITAYESLVADLENGYSMCIYEYTNDLACRNLLEEHREDPHVASLWTRVEATDAVLRQLLLPTMHCFHGDYPRSRFWYWGYPPCSPELEDDLRSRGFL